MLVSESKRRDLGHGVFRGVSHARAGGLVGGDSNRRWDCVASEAVATTTDQWIRVDSAHSVDGLTME